jgi:hypothetical protein
MILTVSDGNIALHLAHVAPLLPSEHLARKWRLN